MGVIGGGAGMDWEIKSSVLIILSEDIEYYINTVVWNVR
jgi:hypothetical protein